MALGDRLVQQCLSEGSTGRVSRRSKQLRELNIRLVEQPGATAKKDVDEVVAPDAG